MKKPTSSFPLGSPRAGHGPEIRRQERAAVPLAERLPGLRALWEETLGDREVRVAVLDGPVDLHHPSLRGAHLEHIPTLVRPVGGSLHGTHVASLIFGQSGSGGVQGCAPRCTGLILPVFEQEPDGWLKPCSQTDLARAIAQALEAGAHILNISGGQLSNRGEAADFLVDAVRQAADRNVLIVAATGNGGCECLHVPAGLEPVLAVGALGMDGAPLPSSNWSDRLRRRGIMAPGEQIVGAVPGGRTLAMSGTSVAAPLVTGVAALLLSLQKKLGRPVDPSAVRHALLAGAAPCQPESGSDCRRLLAGTLDIAQTVGHLLGAAAFPRPLYQRRLSAQARGATSSGARTVRFNQGGFMTGNEEAPLLAADPSSVEPSYFSLELGSLETDAVEPSCACQSRPGPEAPRGTPAGSLISPHPASVRPSASDILADDLYSSMLPFPSGQKAFTIGRLYYDFGTEARRDYFIAQFSKYKHPASSIYNPTYMADYLAAKLEAPKLPTEMSGAEVDEESFAVQASEVEKTNMDAANGLIWTIYIDQDPVFAVVPQDQYSWVSFVRLGTFLRAQAKADPALFRVAVAGTVRGTITLFNGTVVPILRVLSRGMWAWEPKQLGNNISDETKNFIQRVYYELRNLGITSEERAKNYAATNVYVLDDIFKQMNDKKFFLDSISAGKSPICRRNSDCWDIRLKFFHKEMPFTTPREVWEYTIDVSDVIPVQVGQPRNYKVTERP